MRRQPPVDDWQDVEDWQDVPVTPTPVQTAPPPPIPEPSLIDKWNRQWINRPLLSKETTGGIYDPAAAANFYDDPMQRREDDWKIPSWVPYAGGGSLKALGAGMLEGAGDVVSSLTSPLNLATMGAGAVSNRALTTATTLPGKSAYAYDVAPKLANVARRTTQALSVPVIGQGAGETYEGIRTGDYGRAGMGVATMAGGGAGLAIPGRPKPLSELPPIKPPAIDLPLNKVQDPNYAGGAGDAELAGSVPYPKATEGGFDPSSLRDLQPAKPKVRLNSDGTYTNLETGEITDSAGKTPGEPVAETSLAPAPVNDFTEWLKNLAGDERGSFDLNALRSQRAVDADAAIVAEAERMMLAEHAAGRRMDRSTAIGIASQEYRSAIKEIHRQRDTAARTTFPEATETRPAEEAVTSLGDVARIAEQRFMSGRPHPTTHGELFDLPTSELQEFIETSRNEELYPYADRIIQERLAAERTPFGERGVEPTTSHTGGPDDFGDAEVIENSRRYGIEVPEDTSVPSWNRREMDNMGFEDLNRYIRSYEARDTPEARAIVRYGRSEIERIQREHEAIQRRNSEFGDPPPRDDLPDWEEEPDYTPIYRRPTLDETVPLWNENPRYGVITDEMENPLHDASTEELQTLLQRDDIPQNMRSFTDGLLQERVREEARRTEIEREYAEERRVRREREAARQAKIDKAKTIEEIESNKEQRTPALERLGKMVGDEMAGKLVRGEIVLQDDLPVPTSQGKKWLPDEHERANWDSWADQQIAYEPSDPNKPGITIQSDTLSNDAGYGRLRVVYRNDEGVPVGVLSASNSGISILAATKKLGLNRGPVAIKMLMEALKRGVSRSSGGTSQFTNNLVSRAVKLVNKAVEASRREGGEAGFIDYDEIGKALNDLLSGVKSAAGKAGKAIRGFFGDESGEFNPNRLQELFEKQKVKPLTPEELAEARQLARAAHPTVRQEDFSKSPYPAEGPVEGDTDLRESAPSLSFPSEGPRDAYGLRIIGPRPIETVVPQRSATTRMGGMDLGPTPGGELPVRPAATQQIAQPIIPQVVPPSRLPASLQGAKPRFNIGADSWMPQFADDIDKALYIVGQTKKSKADKLYMDWLKTETGLSEAALRNAGAQVKAAIRQLASTTEPGDVRIPPVMRERLNLKTSEPKKLPEGASPKEYLEGKSQVDTGPIVPENAGVSSPADVVTQSLTQRLQKAVDNQGAPNALAAEDISAIMDEAAEVLNKIPNGPEKGGIIRQILGANKALLTSWDVSAPGRQGKAFMLNKAWWTSLNSMRKAWGSVKAADLINQSIEQHPSGYFTKPISETGKVGKSFAEKMGLELSSTEEMFNATLGKAFEKYTLIGKSSRAHTAFLNKLRSDQFVSMMEGAKRAGLDPENNLMVAKKYATFINDATGRGSVNMGKWKLERNMGVLNDIFFAPKNMAGQIRTWKNVLDPRAYAGKDPVLRKQSLKSLLAIAGMGLGAGQLAKLIPGVQVSLDPVSADFGKIRVGDTRIDPFGGYQQFPVAAMKFLSGQSTITAGKNAGKSLDLDAGKYGQQSRGSVAERFFTNRLSPAGSFVWAWMFNREFDGKPFEYKKALYERTFPIAAKDIIELAQEDPFLASILTPSTLMGLTGTQHYSGRY